VPSAIALARDAGFTGIEGPAPLDETLRANFFRELEGTPWIAEVTTCTPPGEYLPHPDMGPAEHLASLEQKLIISLPGEPRFISTMAGSDAWNLDDSLRFHEGVLKLQETHGVKISVETHRGRPTYSPWRTMEIIAAFPELRITCDFSHWCVVTERLVLDQESALLDQIATHAHHIHGRVGYAQGPQVPDPRAPEFEAELAAHEHWWDVLLESMQRRGMQSATLTPESGPDGYLQCHPYTRIPVANLWEINRWLGHRQLERIHRS
jgi:sugar phosphate isomerase/epimerase